MCEPVAIGLTIASGLMTAYGQHQQGLAQEKIANYNAATVETQAKDVVDQGVLASDAQRTKVRQILGQQRAAMGASGAEGSSMNRVLDQTVALGEEDVQQIRLNALRDAWGLREQAKATRYGGAVAAASGRSQAVGTLLTTGAQAYGVYRQWNPKKT